MVWEMNYLQNICREVEDGGQGSTSNISLCINCQVLESNFDRRHIKSNSVLKSKNKNIYQGMKLLAADNLRSRKIGRVLFR